MVERSPHRGDAGNGDTMSDERPFYAPNGPPDPPRQPQPGELLFEFYIEPKKMRVRCELRTHPEPYGVEAQFFENEVLMIGRRFESNDGRDVDTARDGRAVGAHEWRKGIEEEGGA